MNNERSKTIVYPNGNILEVLKVREALLLYWGLNAAETISFDRLCKREDLKEEYKQFIDNKIGE